MSKHMEHWESAISMPDESTAHFCIGGPTGHANEDRLDVRLEEGQLRAWIADGHWGDDAAQQTADFWSNEPMPKTREETVETVERLEERLVKCYEGAGTDRTPEAAFIALAIAKGSLALTGYGDCSLLILNGGQVRFELPKKPTWIGLFSRLGLRNRVSVSEALEFRSIPLTSGDYVAVFTDGLNEWQHDERVSITSEEIAAYCDTASAADVVKSLGHLAFSHNAQDDVSLLVHKVP